MLYSCKNITASCIRLKFKKALLISAAFLALTPETEVSFSGLNSITSKVSVPNLSTIFFAVTGPTPAIKPLDKYFSIASREFGCSISKLSTLNCSPHLLFVIKWPWAIIVCPSNKEGILPTNVIFSPLLSILATV